MAKPAQVTTTIVDDRLVIEIPADFLVNSFETGITTNIFGSVNDNQEMLKHFERAFKADDPCAFGYFIDSVCSDAIESGESFVDVDDFSEYPSRHSNETEVRLLSTTQED